VPCNHVGGKGCAYKLKLKHIAVRVWIMDTWKYGLRWTSTPYCNKLIFRMTPQAAASDACRQLVRIREDMNSPIPNDRAWRPSK